MGREYVKKYHTPSSFCKRILAALEDNKYDFYPTFFREQFIPESIEAADAYNKWNQFVAECDWYSNYVATGERSGLIF